MEQCERIRRELNECFVGMSPWDESLPEDLRNHVAGCAGCREYFRELREIGVRLAEMGQRVDSASRVPERAYFETLIDRAKMPVPILELLAFIGAGIGILTGIAVAFRSGYGFPVEVFLGLIAVLLPLLILPVSLKEGIDREE